MASNFKLSLSQARWGVFSPLLTNTKGELGGGLNKTQGELDFRIWVTELTSSICYLQ